MLQLLMDFCSETMFDFNACPGELDEWLATYINLNEGFDQVRPVCSSATCNNFGVLLGTSGLLQNTQTQLPHINGTACRD
jgi:hypothetical protein